jgi:alkanesulfonate monooxygenase SsuD/methylene tetrahydromethanopterin reductase-like flavin-dependent oxidoreductase (luciferase family)
VGAVCHCHVGPTSQAARSTFEPHYQQYWSWVQDLIRVYTPHAGSLPFDFQNLLAGPAVCGSPAEVIERIGRWHELLDLDRFLFMFDLGGLADRTLCETLERFGTEVRPAVAPLSTLSGAAAAD